MRGSKKIKSKEEKGGGGVFTQLIKLDLSYNQLNFSESYSFRNLLNLEYLYLSFNRIEIIDKDFFSQTTSTANNLKYLNFKKYK